MIGLRVRLRKSTKKVCTSFLGTPLVNDRIMDSAYSRITVDGVDKRYLHRSIELQSSVTLRRRHFVSDLSQHHRFYSTDSSKDLPCLTDLTKCVRPSVLNNLKSIFMNLLVIRPELDRDFSIRLFVGTSQKVVHVVSNGLATCDYNALEDMVTPYVFDQIKRNLPHFMEEQREMLAIAADDIVFSFIHNMQITDNANKTERYLQITTGHEILKGIGELNKMFSNWTPFGNASAGTMEEVERRQKSIQGILANLSFLRTFNVETGAAGDWIINGLNFYSKATPSYPFSNHHGTKYIILRNYFRRGGKGVEFLSPVREKGLSKEGTITR